MINQFTYNRRAFSNFANIKNAEIDMKYYLLLSGLITFQASLVAQKKYEPIPIDVFISLFDKSIGDMDSVFTTYDARLYEINEKISVSWKKGFNLTHTKNNEAIYYIYNNPEHLFMYIFPTDKYWNTVSSFDQTYEGYYLAQASSTLFSRLEDTLENIFDYSAIAKNYKLGKYMIKIYKIGSTNLSIIKVIQK